MTIEKLDIELKRLRTKENLLDFQQYYLPYEDAETIPIYSRYAHINFLKPYGFDTSNKILINEGLNIVRLIIKNTHKYLLPNELDDYLTFLSVSDWDEEDIQEAGCLKFHIFVSRRKQWVISHAKYTKKGTHEEKLIEAYLENLGIDDFSSFVTTSYTSSSEFRTINIIPSIFHKDL